MVNRPIVVLFIGNAISPLITLLFAPVLTRQYSPRAFGEFAIFMGVFSVVSVVSGGRYDFAISVQRSLRRSRILTVGTMAVSLLLLPIWYLGLRFIRISQLDVSKSAHWIAVSLACWGVMQSCIAYQNRKGNFHWISGIRCFQAVTMVSLQATGAYWIGGGLISGFAISTLSAAVLGVLTLFIGANWITSPRILFRTLYHNRQFPVLTAIPAIVAAFGYQIPILLVAAWHSPQRAGQFFIAWKVVSGPATAAMAAMSQYHTYRMTEILHSGVGVGHSLSRYLLESLSKSAMLLTPPCLAVSIIGPQVLPWILGAGWTEAILMIPVLMIGALFRMLFGPFSAVLTVVGALKTGSAWQLISLLVTASCSILFGQSLMHLAIALTISDAILYSLYFALSYLASREIGTIAS